jgi:hypothetical protein
LSRFPSLSGQEDVYSTRSTVVDYVCADTDLELTLDASPTALARVFGLLSTFSVIPAACVVESTDDDTVAVRLRLSNIETSRLDLLHRNFSRLTESISVNVQTHDI